MKEKYFYILLGVGVFVGWSIVTRAKGAVVSAGEALDPANTDNIFASGVNAVGDILDDGVPDGSFSLGGWLYDISHDDIDLRVN